MASIHDGGLDETPTKRVRHRKKQFLKTIKKQMEFYFSDANLSKNRFLGQLVSKDPQVDLTIFLSFNKIRDITTDAGDIKKALKKSDMLALTEDGTKVYRKTRVRQNEYADESTIYVEQLPPDADHEWLKSVFLPYGDVPYVSIPKYQHNGLNKGFAFVEFDSPESATKALEAFGAMGCRLTAEIPPEQICSIKQTITCHREEIPDGVDANFKVPAEAGTEKNSDTKTKKSKPRDSVEKGPNDAETETKPKPVKKRKISFDDDYGGSEDKSKRSEEGRLKKPKAKRETAQAEEIESEQKDRGLDELAEIETGMCSTRMQVEDQGEGKVDDSKEDNVKSPESETKHSKKRKMKKIPEEAGECVENDPEEGSTRSSKKCKKEIKVELDETEIGSEASDDRDSKDEEGSVRLSKKLKKEIKEKPDETEIGTEASGDKDLKGEEGSTKVSKKRKKELKEELDETEICTEASDDRDSKDEEGSDARVSKKRKKEIREEPDETEIGMGPSDDRDSKDEEKENEGSDEVRKKKRSRNHKKKSKKEKTEPEPKMNLRVLSKSEWKRLRNKYLDLQKVKMTQLKQHLYRSRWMGGGSQDYHNGGNASSQDEVREEAGAEKAAKTEKKFTFTPGVIVHLRFPEPPADIKKFKTDAKAHPEVKYVDAREGWNEAYIRCATAEAANQMLAQQTWSQMDILTGMEETAYWDKMNRDREVQCGRNERVKVRGKAKLLAKVEKAVGKHIRFATEEESIGPRG